MIKIVIKGMEYPFLLDPKPQSELSFNVDVLNFINDILEKNMYNSRPLKRNGNSKFVFTMNNQIFDVIGKSNVEFFRAENHVIHKSSECSNKLIIVTYRELGLKDDNIFEIEFDGDNFANDVESISIILSIVFGTYKFPESLEKNYDISDYMENVKERDEPDANSDVNLGGLIVSLKREKDILRDTLINYTEEIISLKSEIKELKNRGFWARVFNTIPKT